MNIPFPEYIRRIISHLVCEGYDSYAVGGCVRDSILGRSPHDWDVTTAALPEDTVRIFSDGDIRVIGTAGIRHGTVMVKAGENVCEITTFRSDGDYKDHRRPDSVTFSKTVEEDLSRRDFTMNAIAAKPCAGGAVIVDPFDGREDIDSKMIRTVGDPARRFAEDALRIMRAVRFSAELGFAVEKRTAETAIKMRDSLEYVSAERITAELWRILCAENAIEAVRAFPEIFEWLAKDGLPGRFFSYIGEVKSPYVRLALMLPHASDGHSFFGRMRFPGKTKAFVLRLLSITDMPYTRQDVCRLMRLFGDGITAAAEYFTVLQNDGTYPGDFLEGEMFLSEVSAIISAGIPCVLSQLSVKGSDVIALGIPDREVGTMLEWLLSEVQSGNVANDKKELLRYILNSSKT